MSQGVRQDAGSHAQALLTAMELLQDLPSMGRHDSWRAHVSVAQEQGRLSIGQRREGMDPDVARVLDKVSAPGGVRPPRPISQTQRPRSYAKRQDTAHMALLLHVPGLMRQSSLNDSVVTKDPNAARNMGELMATKDVLTTRWDRGMSSTCLRDMRSAGVWMRPSQLRVPQALMAHQGQLQRDEEPMTQSKIGVDHDKSGHQGVSGAQEKIALARHECDLREAASAVSVDAPEGSPIAREASPHIADGQSEWCTTDVGKCSSTPTRENEAATQSYQDRLNPSVTEPSWLQQVSHMPPARAVVQGLGTGWDAHSRVAAEPCVSRAMATQAQLTHGTELPSDEHKTRRSVRTVSDTARKSTLGDHTRHRRPAKEGKPSVAVGDQRLALQHKDTLAHIMGAAGTTPKEKSSILMRQMVMPFDNDQDDIHHELMPVRCHLGVVPSEGAVGPDRLTCTGMQRAGPVIAPGLQRNRPLIDDKSQASLETARLQVLLETVTALPRLVDESSICSMICKRMRSLIRCDSVRLHVPFEDEGTWRVSVFERDSDRKDEKRTSCVVSPMAKEGLVRWAAWNHESVVSDDAHSDARYSAEVDGQAEEWTPLVALALVDPDDLTHDGTSSSPVPVLQVTGIPRRDGGSPWSELQLILLSWIGRALSGQLAAIARHRAAINSARQETASTESKSVHLIRQAATCISYPPRAHKLGEVAAIARALPNVQGLSIWKVHLDSNASSTLRPAGDGVDENHTANLTTSELQVYKAERCATWGSFGGVDGSTFSSKNNANGKSRKSRRVVVAVTTMPTAFQEALSRSVRHPTTEATTLMTATDDYRGGCKIASRCIAPGEHIIVEVQCSENKQNSSQSVMIEAAVGLIVRCASFVLQATGATHERELQRRHQARVRWVQAITSVKWKKTRTRLALQEARVRSMEEQAHGMRQRASLLLESAAVLEAAREEQEGDQPNSTRSLSVIAQRIMQFAETQLVVDRTSLFLFEPASLELHAVYSTGLDRQIVVSVRGGQAQRAGLAAAAIAQDRTIVVRDAYSHAWFNPSLDRDTGYRTQSVVVIPLRSTEGEIIGVVQLINKRPYVGKSTDVIAFSPEDVSVAEAVCTQVSLTIEIMRAKRQSENAIELLIKERLQNKPDNGDSPG